MSPLYPLRRRSAHDRRTNLRVLSTIEMLEQRRLLAATFAAAQTIGSVGDLNFPMTVVSGDFDDNGTADVAAVGYNALVWYSGDGTGAFGPAQVVSTDVRNPGRIEAADVNGDGRVELVAVSYEYPVQSYSAKSKISWFGYDTSSNTWTQHVVTVGNVGGLQAVAVADMDRDGDADIVATNYRFEESRRVVWFENDGSSLNWITHTISDNGSIGTGSRAVDVADFNADGWLDLAVTSRFSGTVAVYLNPQNPQTSVTNWTANVLDTAMYDGTGVVAADLDGDGDTDIAATSDSGAVRWYRNDVGAFTKIPLTSVYRPWSVDAADLDSDGDMDLVVGGVGHADVVENLGAGVFAAPVLVGTSVDAWTRAADVNGDGRMDLLSVDAPGNKVVWFANTTNRPPNAVSETYVTTEDASLVVSAPGVLQNDSDPDGDTISLASVVSGPTHGVLTVLADGSFSYTPDPDYSGSDSFTYQITDGHGGTNQATTSLRILSIAEQMDELRAQIDALYAANVLNSGLHNSLITRVDKTEQKLADPRVASNQLTAFVNHVHSLVAEDVLTTIDGDRLIDLAEALRLSILE